MTRGADRLPVSDHAVLRYLERILGVDVDTVRRTIHDETRLAIHEGARGVVANGVVYRLQRGYVTTCLAGEPAAVKFQHMAARKKILRTSRNVPLRDME